MVISLSKNYFSILFFLEESFSLKNRKQSNVGASIRHVCRSININVTACPWLLQFKSYKIDSE